MTRSSCSKTILCYGDSLTQGFDATGPARHSYEDRWPSVLQEGQGEETGCAFFDAGTVASTTPLDGAHLDAENTRAVGKGPTSIVTGLLGI